MNTKNQEWVRRRLASASMVVNGEFCSDNLSIALCSYFTDHVDRPDGDADTESDDNCWWGEWVVEQVDSTLSHFAALAADAISEGAP